MMQAKQKMSLGRFYFVAIVLSAMPAVLVWHLARLQVVPGSEKGFEFLQGEGEARTLRTENIRAYRGAITDRNGELLAVSTPVTSLFVNPQKVDAKQVGDLAHAINMSTKELEKRLAVYSSKQFMYLKRHLPPHEAEQVMRLGLKGVYAEEEFKRYYPAGEVTAHVVGFTDVDDRGREGVELGFDSYLSGEEGAQRVIKDRKGNVVKNLGLIRAPKPGSDLALTIDLRLQYLAYKELKHAIEEQNAKSGSMVILDAKSGEVLAMVNQPSYNPNDRSSVNPDQLRNRAFTDVFEPGSTMKPFTVMAALETGKYSPDYEIDTSPGHIFIAGKMIPDPVNYGVIDLTKIIAKSSQVGISKLALEIDPNLIRDMYFRAGVGQSSGAGFPGESVGVLPSHTKWHPIEQVTFAYGYGLSMNAVQLAQAYSMIANEGEFRPASLIMQESNIQPQRVVKKNIARQVKQMLVEVVAPGGTATRADIESYSVAGKTGTAHKVQDIGYADDKYIAFFAGFAPTDNPEVVAVVIINEPPSDGDYSGGKSAAPVFASTVEQTLKILRVPPHIERNGENIIAVSSTDDARVKL